MIGQSQDKINCNSKVMLIVLQRPRRNSGSIILRDRLVVSHIFTSHNILLPRILRRMFSGFCSYRSKNCQAKLRLWGGHTQVDSPSHWPRRAGTCIPRWACVCVHVFVSVWVPMCVRVCVYGCWCVFLCVHCLHSPSHWPRRAGTHSPRWACVSGHVFVPVWVPMCVRVCVCGCVFFLTHPHIGRGGQGHIARGERDIGGEGRQGAASSCDNVLSPSYFVIFFSVLILINFSNFFTSCLMSFFFIPTFEKGCALNGIRIRLVGAIWLVLKYFLLEYIESKILRYIK